LKQSISLPIGRFPSHARNRTIRSAGPSSLASRCVTRQVARTARTNRVQKLASSIFLDQHRPSPRKVAGPRPSLLRLLGVVSVRRPDHPNAAIPREAGSDPCLTEVEKLEAVTSLLPGGRSRLRCC
jgi:hypothetical protein